MSVYQESTALSSRHYRPVLEVKVGKHGALLCAGKARYDSLQEYVDMFAAPLSSLRGVGLWTFYDPLCPQCTLLLRCEPEPWCARCQRALEACRCPF
jgi:hypothetical protein